MASLSDPPSLFLLVQAVASLDGAADGHESGSKSWSMIKEAQDLVTSLVRHEVNDTWPEEDEDDAPVNGARAS